VERHADRQKQLPPALAHVLKEARRRQFGRQQQKRHTHKTKLFLLEYAFWGIVPIWSSFVGQRWCNVGAELN